MDLDGIFKAYDVRGLAPEQLDEEAAHRIGAAFAEWSKADAVAVGYDCRETSPVLAAALIDGITSQGADVDRLGEITTDMVYFAAGSLSQPGAMITASHNPKEYNGIKLCLAGAAPVGAESGLLDIRALVENAIPARTHRGSVRDRDILGPYVDHVLSIVDPSAISALRVAVDGGNGMAGVAIPSVFDRIPAELIGLYLEPDGTFPNHHPDPLRPENLVDIEALMSRESPDLGVAFDGDADRAFFLDDERAPLPGSTVTGIVAAWYLARRPGSSIVHNLICSKAVPEMVKRLGGTPVRTRVGHSYIKQVMAETGAVFGGEHSGHYYFKDNYRADSGILTMAVLLQVLSESGVPLSELRRSYEPYAQSGEINFTVADKDQAIAAVESRFAHADVDHLDGLTVDLGSSWFNLRPSNTEPVLRLNAEAPTSGEVDDLVGTVEGVLGVTG